MTTSRFLAIATLLVLSACNKQTDKQVQAGGEILPGSASDAMLPLDTVTSQPPLAPITEKAPGTGKPSTSAGVRPDAAGAPDSAPVPAPVPAPAAPDTPPG